MSDLKKSRNSFTGALGFVLAAAGSAVGLGNIWRFPYLAAKDGGGLFLIVYLFFALTFGFALLISEISIGRITKEGPLTAYKKIAPKWWWLGILAFVIPAIIVPYYNVIGGWVVKYMWTYVSLHGKTLVADGAFGGFIANPWQSIVCCLVFSLIVFLIVYLGVENGIEKFSKFVMPFLVILFVGIAIYALFIKITSDDGITRTGLQGAAVYLIPSFKGVTFSKFLSICLDAIGQLFYSLSIAMGIMITYGSYMKDDVNLGKSVTHIEIFDTGVAVLAGFMIISTVYAFSGTEGMKSGPGLMFIYLPKCFDSLGIVGHVVGIFFFVLVLFAALTSSVSLLEALVCSIMDRFKSERKKTTILVGLCVMIVSVIVCLGYNVFYFKASFLGLKDGQILDVFDYISNNLLMPIMGCFTCILVGWVLRPQTQNDIQKKNPILYSLYHCDVIVNEVQKNGEKFFRKNLYVLFIKYFCPILLILIFINSFGIF